MTRSRNQKLLIVFILLVSAALRFSRLKSFAGFDFDQETAVNISTNILSGKLTLIGQEVSTGGIFVGPLYNYILAILLFFSGGNPIILYSSQAVLGVVTTYLVYKIASLHKGLGWLAALIYTFSYRFIYIDKTAAPSNWLVFLTALSIFVFSAKKLSKTSKLIATATIAGFASQLHPAGIALITLPVFIFLEEQKLPSIKQTFFSTASFIIWFTPLILFDLRHQFLNLNGLLTATNSHSYPLVFRFFSRANLALDTLLTAITFNRDLLVIFFALLTLLWFKKSTFSSKISPFVVLTLSGPIIFTIYSGSVADYYLLPSLLAALIIFSIYLSKLFKQSHLSKFIVGLFLVLFITNNIYVFKNSSNPNSLKAKTQTLNYIKAQPESSIKNSIRIHLDTDLGQGNGFLYLTDWLNMSVEFTNLQPDFTIYIPQNRGVHEVVFGGIGVSQTQ